MTRHTAIDRMLLAYATGGLGPEEALVVAALLALDAGARREVAHYEAFGGRVIEEEKPADVRCLAAVMACIERAAPPARPETPRMPEPLSALLHGCAKDSAACWEALCAGVQRISVRVHAGRAARQNLFLMRLAPHAAMTAHSHSGPEITLVLEGSYSDGLGRYAKGDIVVIAEPSIVHTPRAGGEGCTCLVLAEGPLRLENPLQRLLGLLSRI